ncbi:MAG: hypothetical protein JKY65_09235 [Planctomycetes bacterium]|nr:hypothetical protein [Planctomycetota bacterium]
MSPKSQRFGRYSILSVLGQGGMGTVYLARHPEIGFEVAIKVLTAAQGHDTVERKRFQREIRTLGLLQRRFA